MLGHITWFALQGKLSCLFWETNLTRSERSVCSYTWSGVKQEFGSVCTFRATESSELQMWWDSSDKSSTVINGCASSLESLGQDRLERVNFHVSEVGECVELSL